MIDYKGVIEIATSEYVVSRSRFIATIKRVTSYDEANEFVESISKKFSDATHNCYAYIVNPEKTEMKFSDDKEPQGTAGLPILEVLKKKDIACTAIVVTRYFGGVKLGTGGLVSAYTKAALLALEVAKVGEYKYSHYNSINIDYSIKNKVENIIFSLGGDILDICYSDTINIKYASPIGIKDDLSNKLLAITSGQIKINEEKKEYHIYK